VGAGIETVQYRTGPTVFLEKGAGSVFLPDLLDIGDLAQVESGFSHFTIEVTSCPF